MGGSTDPDGDRGFGRIHLESALPFDGEDVWALYVEDADGSTTSAGMVSFIARRGCCSAFLCASSSRPTSSLHVPVRSRVFGSVCRLAGRRLSVFVFA